MCSNSLVAIEAFVGFRLPFARFVKSYEAESVLEDVTRGLTFRWTSRAVNAKRKLPEKASKLVKINRQGQLTRRHVTCPIVPIAVCRRKRTD